MLKVGLVGVGGMGSVHLKNWRAMEGVQLTAICDIRHDLLNEKADGKSCILVLMKCWKTNHLTSSMFVRHPICIRSIRSKH